MRQLSRTLKLGGFRPGSSWLHTGVFPLGHVAVRPGRLVSPRLRVKHSPMPSFSLWPPVGPPGQCSWKPASSGMFQLRHPSVLGGERKPGACGLRDFYRGAQGKPTGPSYRAPPRSFGVSNVISFLCLPCSTFFRANKLRSHNRMNHNSNIC